MRIASAHPVLAGVPSLYQNNGNTISLFGVNPDAEINFSLTGQGLYAVYDATQQVPEPSSLALLGMAILGIAARRRGGAA